MSIYTILFFFFFNDTATTEIYTLSLHDALPIPGRSWTASSGSLPRGWQRYGTRKFSQDRLVIGPGLGYFLGSNPEPSLAALAGIRALRARFGLPILVCPSRK